MVRPMLAALVLTLGLCVAHGASAQSKQWDQAAVTDAAANLTKSIDGLRDVVRGSPQLQVPSSRRTYIYEILDNLRLMEFQSQTLHAELKKGAGLEETTPAYNRLQQIRRDTQVIAQKVDISAITKPKLDEAQKWLAVLEPYYPPQPQVQDLR